MYNPQQQMMQGMQPGMPGMQRPMYPTGVPQPGMAPGMMAPQQVQPQIPVPKPDPPKPKYLLLIRRKRPTDKSLPKKIESYVPESKLYNEMLEFERRLDATIMRKTLDIQDALAKPSKKITKTLRVFLSNTSANQTLEDSLKPNDPDYSPCWTFKIEGKLLDPSKAKFTSFFKQIVIEIQRDNMLYPQGNWTNVPGTPEMDGLEVKRRGDQNVDLKIMLFLDTLPEKHKLSPQLSKLLDMHTETLSSVIMALWQYIKSNRLQDADDRRIIICDEKLQQIFGMPKIMFPNIPELLARHLFPADPVILNYTVRYISLTRVDKLYHFNSQAFDIQVPILDPVREKLAQANVGNPTINREIQALDDKIAAVVQTINLAKLKRDFMHGFVEDPVKFINQWIASQSRDLEIILGDTRLNSEELKQSKIFEDGTFQEALFHYLRSKDVR